MEKADGSSILRTPVASFTSATTAAGKANSSTVSAIICSSPGWRPSLGQELNLKTDACLKLLESFENDRDWRSLHPQSMKLTCCRRERKSMPIFSDLQRICCKSACSMMSTPTYEHWALTLPAALLGQRCLLLGGAA